eukprot:PhM_4_TR16514/c0_g1_i2/m.29502/K10746/EXO1; exonuclease 1
MGVSGLWKALESMQHTEDLSKFRNCTMGVDALNVMYELGRRHAVDLGKGDVTSIVTELKKFVNAFLKFGIKILFVFDGNDVPAKKKERQSRRAGQRHALYLARTVEDISNSPSSNNETELKPLIRSLYADALTFSGGLQSQIARLVDGYRGTRIMFSPGEAEAQLAYMSRHNMIQIVYSGDSDLIPYYAGTVIRQRSQRHHGCYETYYFLHSDQWQSSGSLRHVQSPPMFALCCAVAGCDYTPNRSRDIQSIAETAKQMFKNNFIRAIDHFAAAFQDPLVLYRAVFTLLHHYVYDPIKGLVTFNFPVIPELLSRVGGAVEAVLGPAVSDKDMVVFAVNGPESEDALQPEKRDPEPVPTELLSGDHPTRYYCDVCCRVVDIAIQDDHNRSKSHRAYAVIRAHEKETNNAQPSPLGSIVESSTAAREVESKKIVLKRQREEV